MRKFKGTKGNWRLVQGNHHVITDVKPINRHSSLGYDLEAEKKLFGGYLVCCDIPCAEDAALLSSAKLMFEALDNLENDDGSIPEHAWKLVQEALDSATNIED